MCICTPHAGGPAAGDLAVAAGACGSEGICTPYADGLVSECASASPAQVDLLPEIKQPPHFRPPTAELLPLGLAAEVDSYMATRQPGTFLAGLKQRLLLPEHEYINSGYGTKYNVELLNSLVFYVGIKVGGLNFLRSLPMRASSSDFRKAWAAPVMHQQAADTGARLKRDIAPPDTEGIRIALYLTIAEGCCASRLWTSCPRRTGSSR